MALIQLPQQQTFGSALGAGMGSGLAGGISSLIDMKLKRLQDEQKVKSLEESLKPLVSPEKAALYAQLGKDDPKVLGALLQQDFDAPGRQAYQQARFGQEGLPGIAEPEQTQAPMQPAQPQLEQPVPPEQLAQQAVAPAEPAGVAPAPQKPRVIPKKPAQKFTMADKLRREIAQMKTALPNVGAKYFDRLANEISNKEAMLTKLVVNEQREKNAERRFERQQDLAQQKHDLQKEKHMANLSAQDRKEKRLEQEKIDKKNEPALDKIRSKAEAALMDKARFAEMEEINNEGDLGSNAFNIFVDALEHGLFGLGVNLTSLQTADAQAMKKLSKDFIKNVKETLGTSRITQAEVQLYLSTIPNLMQSPEGRARVIKTNQLMNEIPIIKNRIANDMIEKNNGEIPKNFKGKLFQNMEPYLKKLESQIKGVNDEVKKNMAVQKKEKVGLGKDLEKAFDQIATPGQKEAPQGKAPETLLGLENARPFLKHIFPWV